MINRVYSSVLPSAFPLYFKKIDSSFLSLKDCFIFKNAEAKAAWESGGKKTFDSENGFEIKESDWRNRSFFVLFLAPVLAIAFNIAVVCMYMAQYDSFSADLVVLSGMLLLFFWSSYWSASTNMEPKKADFITLCVVGLPTLGLMIYGFMFSNPAFSVSSMSILISLVVFLEGIKPVEVLKNSPKAKLYEFGLDKKYLLIVEEI